MRPSQVELRNERGAVATIVAVLLGIGLFMGFAAIAIDGGRIMYERRQVQNGADATSLALAQICAEAPAQCKVNEGSTPLALSALNNANAADGLSGFDTNRFAGVGICGARLPATAALAGCTSASESTAVSDARASGLNECLRLPSWLAADASIPYVEVHTQTRSAEGTFLPSALSSRVFGSADKPVEACARAAWGPVFPSSRSVLNIVMSECDWRTQTGYTGPGTASYPAGPSGPSPGYAVGTWPAVEQRIYTKGNPTTCDTSSPGGTAPGGFAALDAVSDCQRVLTLGPDGKAWAHGNPGNDLPCSEAQLLALRGSVVHIPIFDCQMKTIAVVSASTNCQSGVGNNTYYRISGYAAFYLAGWHLSSTDRPSLRPPHASACTGGDRCLVGWFLQDVVDDVPLGGSGGGSPAYGLIGISSAG